MKEISDKIKKILLEDIDKCEIRNQVAMSVLCNIIGYCEADKEKSIPYETILMFVKEKFEDINK